MRIEPAPDQEREYIELLRLALRVVDRTTDMGDETFVDTAAVEALAVYVIRRQHLIAEEER